MWVWMGTDAKWPRSGAWHDCNSYRIGYGGVPVNLVSAGKRSRASRTWLARDEMAVASCYARYTDLVIADADGSYLMDIDGSSYLDFATGVGAVILGHRHPSVAEAVRRQLDSYWQLSTVGASRVMIEAAEAIAGVCPGPLSTVFLANSGAEGVDAAIKLARLETGRRGIIAFIGSFHGRTIAATAATTAKSSYRAGHGTGMPDYYFAKYPYCRRTCSHAPEAACPLVDGREIDHLFRRVVAPSEVAAVIVEPIQGDGGYVVPPAGFLTMLRRLCSRYGIVLVFDEAQSGLGRTGRWMACEHEDVVPDLIVLAKGLANGLPIGAVVGRRELMRAWPPGSHGATFGGNAVVCSAAKATVGVITRLGLLERARVLWDRISARMQGLQGQVSGIAEVRGRGLMVGLEFEDGRGDPDGERVLEIRRRCLEAGLVVLSCGADDHVIRLMPPLTITDDEVEVGIGILEEAIALSAWDSEG